MYTYALILLAIVSKIVMNPHPHLDPLESMIEVAIALALSVAARELGPPRE